MQLQRVLNSQGVATTNFLQIDGVYMPTPSKMSVDYYDLSVDAWRDASGINHIDFARFDVVKVNCEWKYLTQAGMNTLLNAVKGKGFFQITYFDPMDNDLRTITVNKGDRKAELYSFRKQEGEYVNFQLAFVEK